MSDFKPRAFSFPSVPLKLNGNFEMETPIETTKQIKLYRPNYYDLPKSGRLEDLVKDMPMFLGTAIKYLVRCGQKDSPVQELTKAIECLKIEIQRIEATKGSVWNPKENMHE